MKSTCFVLTRLHSLILTPQEDISTPVENAVVLPLQRFLIQVATAPSSASTDALIDQRARSPGGDCSAVPLRSDTSAARPTARELHQATQVTRPTPRDYVTRHALPITG